MVTTAIDLPIVTANAPATLDPARSHARSAAGTPGATTRSTPAARDAIGAASTAAIASTTGAPSGASTSRGSEPAGPLWHRRDPGRDPLGASARVEAMQVTGLHTSAELVHFAIKHGIIWI
jgi:hypothetical protein